MSSTKVDTQGTYRGSLQGVSLTTTADSLQGTMKHITTKVVDSPLGHGDWWKSTTLIMNNN